MQVSFKVLVLDFLGDFFTFDSRFFRSLIPLAFRPGFLTNEYTEGRRTKYILPIRIYLFISVVFFFVISLQSLNSGPVEVNPDMEDNNPLMLSFKTDTGDAVFSVPELKAQVDSLGVDSFLANLGTAEGFARFVSKKVIELAYEDGESIYSYAISKIPTLLFFLLPVFALLLWILFRKREPYYINHLIFAFHFHAFLFLLFTVVHLVNQVFSASPYLSANILLGYIYFAFSLRNVYHTSWVGSFLGGLLFYIIYAFVLAIGLASGLFAAFLVY